MRTTEQRGMADVVITVIGRDRPGLVEAIAAAIAQHGGNWLEGRMAHLAGQFAGLVRIEVAKERVAELREALARLESGGLQVRAEGGTEEPARPSRAMDVELLALDRPGLLHEVSHLLATRRVNIEELETEVYSAPMTGDRMFRAQARVSVPAEVDEHELRESFERLARDLMVDIRLAEPGQG
jgi:glycine cleavage system regulatory protein